MWVTTTAQRNSICNGEEATIANSSLPLNIYKVDLETGIVCVEHSCNLFVQGLVINRVGRYAVKNIDNINRASNIGSAYPMAPIEVHNLNKVNTL